MDGASINRSAWNAQARALLPYDRAQGVPSRFEWTQYPGHGPGIELFGDVRGLRVAELGCGCGDNLALLAMRGARCVGVDVAPAQIRRALTRWSHLPIRFRCTDASTFLAASRVPLDVCFSVFGAVGHSPPEQILPTIASRLRPGGRLLFSVADPQWLGPDRHYLRLPDGSSVRVARWTASPTGWRAAIHAAGLRMTKINEVRTPNDSDRCCTIVTAVKPVSP